MRQSLGQVAAIWMALHFCSGSLRADQVLYRYEGNVLPYDSPANWSNNDPCSSPCIENIIEGRFRLSWPEGHEQVSYAYIIAQAPQPAPTSLWSEWRYKSNKAVPPGSNSCDGQFIILYRGILEVVSMYGDAAFSFSGSDFVTGLTLSTFHTFRFESLNGIDYRVSVDGSVFIVDSENSPFGIHYLSFAGEGACTNDSVPNHFNEWDFVRYGTIGTGEQLVSVSPPNGALGPSGYTSFTSFLVTFDQPNYVYVDDITVSVTGGIAPVVTATRRTDTHDEHTVEIVLDRALPTNELTTFTFNDGQQTTNILYDFRPGPAAIPTSSTSSLLTLVIVLTLAAGFILRNRAPA